MVIKMPGDQQFVGVNFREDQPELTFDAFGRTDSGIGQCLFDLSDFELCGISPDVVNGRRDRTRGAPPKVDESLLNGSELAARFRIVFPRENINANKGKGLPG